MPTSKLPPASRAALEQARDRAQAAAAATARQASRLSLLRLVAFVALVAVAVFCFAEVHPAAGLAAVVIGLLAFNRLVGRQQALDREHATQLREAEVLQGELRSLDYELDGFDGGGDYRDPQHPYTSDLDVFGANSVFQLLNRTSSLVGREALAYYFREVLQDAGQIVARQEAIAELADVLDWRTRFAAYGSDAVAAPAIIDKLRTWALTPAQLTERWWPAAIWGLSLFNVAWLASFAYLPFYFALLGYLPTVWLLRRAKPHVDAVHAQTEEAVATLTRYERMIGAIESQAWSSQLLQTLSGYLDSTHDTGASQVLRGLAHESRQLALRVNPFVLLLNLFSLWEVRYARRLEARKAAHLTGPGAVQVLQGAYFDLPTASPPAERLGRPASRLDAWLVSLGAFDALSSLAAAAYRWPHWTTPTITPEQRIAGEGLHHPLLAPARSVANGLAMPTRGHIKLLTGSNMAGKSTFLRTVGLHVVLAHCGSRVPAAALSVPLLRVYTSMRTQDDLHEGASAFYAELQRLRIVVEATQRGENVFFLLDEILKGTNSQDRHEGGRALLEQLIRHGGAGVVATHDLELGALAAETSAVDNVRLEVDTDADGRLYFDYTVKPGLAESRNASALMRQLGLGVDAAGTD